MQPRFATKADYDRINAVKARCFNLSPIDMENSGACYELTRAGFRPENAIVCEKNGDLIACMHIISRAMHTPGAIVPVGAVAGVATLPEARGQGCMSAMLDLATITMRERGQVLSALWGDSCRYRRFGWEMAGYHYIFTLSARTIAAVRPAETLAPIGPEHLAQVAAMHRANAVFVERSENDYAQLNRWRGAAGWITRNAYCITAHGQIIEFGGDTDSVIALIARLFKEFGWGFYDVFVPSQMEKMVDKLYALSHIWHLEPLGMLKVIDLDGLLKCYGRTPDSAVRALPPLELVRTLFPFGTKTAQSLDMFFNVSDRV